MTMPLRPMPDIPLSAGKHWSLLGGACVMELVSYVAGEPWSDHPRCASSTLTELLITWNDRANDEDRQQLKGLVPRLVGTRGSAEQEAQRRLMIADWLFRDALPVLCEAAQEPTFAARYRGLAEIDCEARLDEARRGTRDIQIELWRRRDRWLEEIRAAVRDELTRRGLAAGAVVAAVDAVAAVAVVAAVAAVAAGRSEVYRAVRLALEQRLGELLTPLRAELQRSALALVERLIAITGSAT